MLKCTKKITYRRRAIITNPLSLQRVNPSTNIHLQANQEATPNQILSMEMINEVTKVLILLFTTFGYEYLFWKYRLTRLNSEVTYSGKDLSRFDEKKNFCVNCCITNYGLKTLKRQWCFLTKKSPLCNKRKARDIWATHKVTRNANQLYALSSFNSTQKIRFVQPNGDSTFIQTSHSHKKRNLDKLQSQAVCNKRSPHSYLTLVRRDWLFRR